MGILKYPAYIIAFELQYSVGEWTSTLAGVFLVMLKLHQGTTLTFAATCPVGQVRFNFHLPYSNFHSPLKNCI